MDTLNAVFTHSRRAAACALVVLLSACGGAGGGSAPDAVASTVTPVATPTDGADVAAQPAPSGASPVEVPSPPDMSIAPPPGTVVTPQAPVAPANVASADAAGTATGTIAAPGTATGAPATVVTLGAPVAVDLPAGATPCQPSICPAFASNGSVTNTQGTDDPSAARAYLFAGSGPSGAAYPDLGGLPTMVLPTAPLTIVEAPGAAPD